MPELPRRESSAMNQADGRPVSGAVIELSGIHKSFGAPVLRGVDLRIERAEITALLGANGAGKSTLFNVASGFVRPDTGTVSLGGRDVTGVPAHRRAREGVGRVFQDVRLFDGLTAVENVMVGDSAWDERPGAMLVNPLAVRRAERARRQRALELLEYVDLPVSPTRGARELSYGQRKRVAIARALMAEPTVLLLDEPSAGLDPEAVGGLIGLVRRLPARGVTVWFIEHNREVTEALATQVAFLAEGAIVAYGATHDVVDDERLARLYLG